MNSAFLYAQPFLVTAGINLAAYPKVQPYNNYGYGLIGAYFMVYVGIAVSHLLISLLEPTLTVRNLR